MTEVYYNAEDFYLHSKGHAGGGPAGQDVICAGVSALTMALLNVLMEESKKEHAELEYKVLDGELMMKARPYSAHYAREMSAYFKVTITGLKAIADNYPGNVEVKEVWKKWQ